jgi:hypothetical protein
LQTKCNNSKKRIGHAAEKVDIASMTNEYAIAINAHNTASKIFVCAQNAYRARTIGDAEFIAARKAFAAATEIFDAAFAKESAIEEAVEVETANDSQLALF